MYHSNAHYPPAFPLFPVLTNRSYDTKTAILSVTGDVICSMSPWKALEGTVASLIGLATYYAFRLGDNLLFAGPYGPALSPTHPSPLRRTHVRRSSSTASPGSGMSNGGGGGGHGSLGSAGSDSPGGMSTGTPVSRAKAVASGAAKVLARGWGGTRGASSLGGVSKGMFRVGSGSEVDVRIGGDTFGSGTTAAPTPEPTAGGRRWGDSGVDGARIERAVSEALDR